MKTIEVTVAPDGRSRVETKGFAGAACQVASRFLLQTLGICTDQQRTGEFYRISQNVENSTQLKS